MEQLESIKRLARDVKSAAVTLSTQEARFLVDTYYGMQDERIRADGQVRAMEKSDEPHSVLSWLSDQSTTLEGQIKRALDAYSASHPLGEWARSIVGIGPVIAAGLLAHIDIEKAPTAGHIWNFAGLNPDVKWEKGKKRPWNATLKTLCWKIGESFVKVSNNENDFYGKIYAARKASEIAKNDAGDFAPLAAAALLAKKFGADTQARKYYEEGKLPPAHVHARAKRYAVKLFLSHYQHVGWVLAFNEAPPKPYVMVHMGHAHYIPPPNFSQSVR